VSVVNVSKAEVLTRQTFAAAVTATANDPRRAELRVTVPAGWNADPGDVLEAIATYRVTAGLITDLSTARTSPIVAA
jgi:hypothetical protein